MISPLGLLKGAVPASFLLLIAVAGYFYHESHKWHAQLLSVESSYKAAQVVAQQQAQQAHDQAEARYKQLSEKVQNDYQSQSAAADAAASKYIAADRVRLKAPAGSGGPAVASAQSPDPAVPAGMPADSVMVSADDVQACTTSVTYALQAHNWAITLP